MTAGPLPHNPEAERVVLGAILIDPALWPTVAAAATLEDFFIPRHRLVFGGLSRLASAGRAVDLVTLKDALPGDELERAGGAAALAGLLDGMPKITNVGQWLELLRDASAKRRIIARCDEAMRRARNGETSAEILRDLSETFGAGPGFGRGGAAVLMRMADVAPEAIEWLWPGFLPLGKVVMLDGDPGLGKSTVTLDIAARLSRGTSMPDGSTTPAAGTVLLSAEDGLADTVRPRLLAAGADLERVVALTGVRDGEGHPRPPYLPGDLDAVREAIRDVAARLVVIDPIMAYLDGRIDSRQDQDVRGALRLVSELAEQERVACLVVRHLRKTAAGGNALYRGSGSIAFLGAARVGLLAARDPSNDRACVVAQTKNNLAALAPTLGYEIIPEGASSRIRWRGVVEVSAAEVVAASEQAAEERGPREDAEEFLRGVLADGPVSSKDVFDAARAAGVADKTLRRAKTALGVRAHKLGGNFGGNPAWYWELAAASTEGGQWPSSADRALPEGGLSTEDGPNKKVDHLQFKWPSSRAEDGQIPEGGHA
jgi:hypothetical protein